MQTWKSLKQSGESLNGAIAILHHAAQFVSMVSNSYLPHLPDDSQNSLHWNSDLETLEGKWIESPKIRMSLDIKKFGLIMQTGERSHQVPLERNTKADVLSDLAALLHAYGANSGGLQPIAQFVIPTHAVEEGGVFEKPADEVLQEWANWRTNAQIVLEPIRDQFQWASDVSIWPHHFDTGLYVPLSRNENGNDTRSVGLGLAIADSEVPEPYFYINHWSQTPIDFGTEQPSIQVGYWHDKSWKGFILPASDIISQSSARQENVVKHFFQDAVNLTLLIMNILPQTLFSDD